MIARRNVTGYSFRMRIPKTASKYSLVCLLLLACSTNWLCYATEMADRSGRGGAQAGDSRRPWKGYAILGNGNLTAVYSDDVRISVTTHHKGIQHFYFGDYTADYVTSTVFDVLNGNGLPVEGAITSTVGMKNFFTTQTQTGLNGGGTVTILCFIHPEGAAVLTLNTERAGGNNRYRFQTLLRKEIKTDQDIRLTSLQEVDGVAVAVWSNRTALAMASESSADQISIDGATVSITGNLDGEASRAQMLLVPASSPPGAVAKLRALRRQGNLEAAANQYWNAWMDRGVLPAFRSSDPQTAQFLEAYKRNLYCVRSANLNGQIPADITGQFVTNNMPQLYPRDAMMCARVLLLAGHADEAQQVIEFWAKARIQMKTPGEWYARYDAHGKAVNGGSGARFDEPEWDSNGYYIYVLNQYHAKRGVWLANPEFIYRLADFLVNHLSPNGLLWEGGIVEWTGYLPATNMIDAAALRIAAKMARDFGDTNRAERYNATAEKISVALPETFDRSRQTYADVRFTQRKGVNGTSLTEQSGQKSYLWDTTANVGVIWGYPKHRAIELSNMFYDSNTVKSGGGMQYFDSPDPGLASYGHGAFFFTTAAASEYQTLYGTKSAAKGFIDWMIRNGNSYGLMPEHILPDGSDCSPASPLSWCSAELAAALLLWSQP